MTEAQLRAARAKCTDEAERFNKVVQRSIGAPEFHHAYFACEMFLSLANVFDAMLKAEDPK